MFSCFSSKKKEDVDLDYDPEDISLNQLKKGSFLDYDLKTWQVKTCYEYDWGDDYFSDEYQITTADESMYLSVEEDDELEITLTKKINVHSIEGNVTQYIIQHDTAPTEVTFKGVRYFRDSEDAGYFRNKDNNNWEEFISWTFYDDSGDKVLSIERWDEEDFEASAGVIAQEYEFSNIIMA